jgi:hypothetical protein
MLRLQRAVIYCVFVFGFSMDIKIIGVIGDGFRCITC